MRHAKSQKNEAQKKKNPSHYDRSRHLSRVNIFQKLKEDHQEILSLCKNIVKEANGISNEARRNFLELEDRLGSHSKIEEEVLYSVLREKSLEERNDELKDLVLDAIEEHHVTNMLTRELSEMDPRDENWMAKMHVLRDAIQTHMNEEEDGLFTAAQDVLDEGEIFELGAEYARSIHEWRNGTTLRA